MLQVETKGGVARVTLDRPDIRNAFDVVHDTSDAMDQEVFAALARSHGLDVFVELSGFSSVHRFAAMAYRCAPVQISYQDLAESIGVSKSSAQAAVGWLVRRKLLAASKQSATATPRYTVLTPWKDRRQK